MSTRTTPRRRLTAPLQQPAGLSEWKRYPGPVWMLGVWLAISGGNLLFAVLFPANLKPVTPTSAAALIWVAVSIVTLAILARRTPAWFMHLQIMGAIVVISSLSFAALTNLGVALFGWAYSMVAMYTGVWFSRRAALAYLVASAVAYLIVLLARDAMPYMLVTWLMTITVCAAMSLLLIHLVGRLRTLAVMDPLTGLFNRTGLHSALANPYWFTTPTSLAVIDLDSFKTLNDTKGHIAGDEVLRAVGAAVTSELGTTERAFRTGGDEFVLILPGLDVTAAHDLVAGIRERLDVAMSVGIVDWQPDENFDSALARADTLMYTAKPNRRGHGELAN